jgi:ParB family transcriptional regulator, chromosome partitioning protein
VANRLRLLDLPDDVLGMVERGELTEGHARAVLAVPDQEDRRKLAGLIVRRGLSVRAAEQAARWAGAKQRPRKQVQPADPALVERTQAAAERVLGKPVKIGRGKVEIAFADEHELAELAEAFEQASGA